MLKIGLTGGIASGKSTAGDFFSKLGVPVIDADVIARTLTEKPDILAKIVNHFGEAILTSAQQLDRAHVRRLIFADAKQRRWLEDLLHPLIYQQLSDELKMLTAAYCVLIIPLLLENKLNLKQSNLALQIDRILLIDLPQELQIQRLQQRDHSNDHQTQQILETQLTRSQRNQYADDYINNSGELSALQTKIEQLHHYYLSLALRS